MSTTKDKSQGPYNYRWSDPNWIVYGPSRPIYLSSEELCILECERLNAAYQAGQAERDELVKVVRLFLKEFNDVLENTPIAYYKVERAATDLLTRITNP